MVNIMSRESIVQAKVEWDEKEVEMTSPKPQTRNAFAKSLLGLLKKQFFEGRGAANRSL